MTNTHSRMRKKRQQMDERPEKIIQQTIDANFSELSGHLRLHTKSSHWLPGEIEENNTKYEEDTRGNSHNLPKRNNKIQVQEKTDRTVTSDM